MPMGPSHHELFADYVRELGDARRIAVNWRRSQIDAAVESGASVDEVEGILTAKYGPPAAHPRVLGAIIKYFFLCQALNATHQPGVAKSFAEPLVFVHEMLSGKHEDLWNFLAELPYLPLGLRADDTRV